MKNYHEQFSGVFTALVTPFDNNGSLDPEAFDTLVTRQLDAGVAGLVPVGTTGEAPTLREDERDQIIGRTVPGQTIRQKQSPGHAEPKNSGLTAAWS